jgi:phosphoribosylformylglycinamidine synthase subunit PurS
MRSWLRVSATFISYRGSIFPANVPPQRYIIWEFGDGTSIDAALTLYSMTQTYQARIYVTLRPSVLDPAGAAVRSGIEHMGFANVSDVRIGKYIEVALSGSDPDSARTEVDQICDRLLANPVIENYRFEIIPSS